MGDLKPIRDVLISLGASGDADSDLDELRALVDEVVESEEYRDGFLRAASLCARVIVRCHQYEREGSPHAAASARSDRRAGHPGDRHRSAPSVI